MQYYTKILFLFFLCKAVSSTKQCVGMPNTSVNIPSCNNPPMLDNDNDSHQNTNLDNPVRYVIHQTKNQVLKQSTEYSNSGTILTESLSMVDNTDKIGSRDCPEKKRERSTTKINKRKAKGTMYQVTTTRSKKSIGVFRVAFNFLEIVKHTVNYTFELVSSFLNSFIYGYFKKVIRFFIGKQGNKKSQKKIDHKVKLVVTKFLKWLIQAKETLRFIQTLLCVKELCTKIFAVCSSLIYLFYQYSYIFLIKIKSLIFSVANTLTGAKIISQTQMMIKNFVTLQCTVKTYLFSISLLLIVYIILYFYSPKATENYDTNVE